MTSIDEVAKTMKSKKKESELADLQDFIKARHEARAEKSKRTSALHGHTPLIAKMLNLGAGWKDIVARLGTQGFEVKESTLRQHVAKFISEYDAGQDYSKEAYAAGRSHEDVIQGRAVNPGAFLKARHKVRSEAPQALSAVTLQKAPAQKEPTPYQAPPANVQVVSKTTDSASSATSKFDELEAKEEARRKRMASYLDAALHGASKSANQE